MKPSPDSGVATWIQEHSDDIVLSALVLAEIAFGVEALAEGKRKASFCRELRFLQEDYADRILSFDESAAWEWARYTCEARNAGYAPPLFDSLIAATARAWDLKVVTQNVRDFPLIDVINPFAS